ncbi:hypothetical protein HBF26_01880 [Luteibacter jiangsuensis]|jgi:hypothetical protein|uniref:Uncharacterized protein n=1 Tax=Luteibacter jiangsuensis TaxID=637577 RepID=A0ABX0PZS7_9GAMM|nr:MULTISPECIES: hypothetical protein [Luteibacter]NID03618.1 hypothetical protein [Luteibacter jiangsuensis]NII54751.1 hypothetical protein [Luteibacter sp. SG786]
MNRSRYYALIALIVALVAIFVVGAIHRGGPAGDVPDDGERAPSARPAAER